MGRGEAWKEAEDTKLVRAWLDVSQDAKKGTDQTGEAFWATVHTTFCSLIDDKSCERTVKALKEHFHEISRCCAKFSGCYQTMTSLNRSGSSETDVFNDSVALYAEQSKTKKSFTFQACWKILKEYPKWSLHVEKVKSSSPSLSSLPSPSSASLSQDGTEPSSEADIRPIGAKKAKLYDFESRSNASQVKAIEIMAEAAKRNSALFEKQIEIQDAKIGLDLFTVSTENLDDEAKEYIRLQKQIRVLKAQKEFNDLQ
jgi:hypothetical protein